MNNKVKPAIIGGLVLGILSVIPFVNWANICCCLWAILGGALAAKLYVSSSTVPAKTGDGAIVGAMAGVVGGLIFIVIGIPITLALGGLISGFLADLVANADPSIARQIRYQQEAQSTVGLVLKSFLGAFLLLVFATIGGLIGVAIFEKRKGVNASPI
jgi:hypothetical protein